MADKQKKQSGTGNAVWMITMVIVCIAMPAWVSLIFGVGVPQYRAFVDTRMEYQFPTNSSVPFPDTSDSFAVSDCVPKSETTQPTVSHPVTSPATVPRTPGTVPVVTSGGQPVVTTRQTPGTIRPVTTRPTTAKPVTTQPVTTCPSTTPVHAHSHVSSVLRAPSCETGGILQYLCACGDVYTKNVAPSGHSFEKTASVKPTLETYGYDLYVCSVCGKREEKNRIAPYSDASYTDFCTMVDLRCMPNLLTPDYDTALPYYLTRKAEFIKETLTSVSVGRQYGAMFNWIVSNSPECCSYGLSLYAGDLGDTGILSRTEERGGYYEEILLHDRRTFEIEDRIIAELGINVKTTQREAIERINDWMCQHLYYDYETCNTDLLVMLETGGGICCGYAGIFNQLCHACGISCECQEGYSDNSSHQWNRVLFSDGSEYYVDVCWNDVQYVKNGVTVDTCVENGISEKRVRELRSQYLLVPYEDFHAEHQDVYHYSES